MQVRFRAVQGAPCWVSLMASDLERAQGFYGDLFGWRFKPSRHGGGHYSIAFADDSPTVGVGSSPYRDPSLPGAWTTYFAADSANEVARRAQDHGGTVAVGPIDFGGGRVAWAADSSGAPFAIWEGDLTSSWWEHRRAGAPLWVELRTRDAFEAALFYGAVFAWDAQPSARCDVRYEHNRVILSIDGQAVAGLCGGAMEAVPDPAVRPRWHVYFRVHDVDAVAERAADLGGTVLSAPGDSPLGRTAALRDVVGAPFSVTSVRADF
ncbi:VOC family protein [Streptomyces sp. B1866]|uniref:VOC family protein n=1 Tax=Streptomyces sp. B1866 TaxID=3075431 RepID=UPI002891EC59|nr:VOC family protein [Streptomyces sp. B1866]MDT3395816.1 VOC family protein [Streptomyces sp. B1866]